VTGACKDRAPCRPSKARQRFTGGPG
jgi:hypothetical protein